MPFEPFLSYKRMKYGSSCIHSEPAAVTTCTLDGIGHAYQKACLPSRDFKQCSLFTIIMLFYAWEIVEAS